MLQIIQGDLLKSDTDTIVNPANGHLAHGGGVARLIANAARAMPADFIPPASMNAREDIFDEAERYAREANAWDAEQSAHPLIATGAAGWTSAGRLPYKGIVHAVGPIWNGGAYMEELLLYSAHAEALHVAASHGCRSVAFPAISCGIFGYPVERAAPVAIAAATNYMARFNGIDRIVFVLFEDAHYEAYQKAAGETA